MKTLISGHFKDHLGRTYFLTLEPAISLANGNYLIQREITLEVTRIDPL
jgi:hypothetical protein